MMEGKISVTFELESDHLEWITDMVEQHDLPDQSKAARILFDYAIEDSDHEEIFAEHNMRCRHCV